MVEAGSKAIREAKRLLAGPYVEPPLLITATFLLFVVVKYMQWGARREIFAVIRFEFMLALALTVVCVAMQVQYKFDFRRQMGVIVWVVLLFVAMLIEIPFAAVGPRAWNLFFDRVIKFAMLTVFLAVFVRSPRTLLWFCGAFLLSICYVTQESTRGAISGSMVWENQGIPRLHGSVPIYSHPNSLGSVAVGAIPFAVFLFPHIKNFFIRSFFVFLVATALVVILYTGSRTAYMGFFGFVLMWFILSKNKKRWAVAAVIVSVVGLPLIPKDYVERFKSIGGQEKEGQSKNTRMEILEDAWTIFLENPGGVGLGSFTTVRQQRFGRFQDTHNLYLEVLTNLGIQGFFVFMGLIVMLLIELERLRKFLEGQMGRVRQLARRYRVPPGLASPLNSHMKDMFIVRALVDALVCFLWVRIVVGIFGHDLYEVYWWFSTGLVISFMSIVPGMSKRTEAFALLLAAEAAAEDEPASL